MQTEGYGSKYTKSPDIMVLKDQGQSQMMAMGVFQMSVAVALHLIL